MNYGQIRDRALQLIDQYSVAGDLVAVSYNNQADYLAKIPGLIHSGLEYLFTTYRPVKASVPLESLTKVGTDGEPAYVLPSDLWRMSGTGLLVRKPGGGLERYSRYYLPEERLLVLDGTPPGAVLVEYYRHANPTMDNPDDNEEIDGTPEMHLALPFYVAAHLVMHDNSYAYQALYNEFEAWAQRMTEGPKSNVEIIQDAYSFDWGGV